MSDNLQHALDLALADQLDALPPLPWRSADVLLIVQTAIRAGAAVAMREAIVTDPQYQKWRDALMKEFAMGTKP